MSKDVSKEIVAKRYAQALFELATTDHVEKTVADDLDDLIASLDNSTYTHLGNTNIDLEERRAAIDLILKKAKSHAITHDFALMLVRQERLSLLPTIAEFFHEMQYHSENVHLVHVTVAKPLAEKQEKLIIESLTKTLQAKKIELDIIIDPSVLGGIRLQYASTLIDNTFNTKINAMAQAMKKD